jgi:dTDP-4-dehydrorhamnose 3,5-epimerase
VRIEEAKIAGLKVITPAKHGDHRGFFSEVYNRRALEKAGVDLVFVQDNHSFSAEAGTIRGLHFQSPPFAQDKLVRVAHGRELDVAVDLRSS